MKAPGALLAALLLPLSPSNAFAMPDADDAHLIGAAIDAGRLLQARAMLIRLPETTKSVEVDALWARLALAEGRNEDALRAFDTLSAGAP